MFSGLSRVSTVPAGSLANAASVGANTVNGPSPFKASTRSAALSAAASVLKVPAATAVSTMSLLPWWSYDTARTFMDAVGDEAFSAMFALSAQVEAQGPARPTERRIDVTALINMSGTSDGVCFVRGRITRPVPPRRPPRGPVA